MHVIHISPKGGGKQAGSMSAVEHLLLDSDEEDLGDLDLAGITLEDILREEELASAANGGDAAASGNPDEELFFTSATVTLAALPGMELVTTTDTGAASVIATRQSPAKSNASTAMDRSKSVTELPKDTLFRGPLELAEAREKQLLSCVGAELVSPLQVKRRLRETARTKHLHKNKSGKQPKKKFARRKSVVDSASSGRVSEKKGGKSSTGVVKVQPMEIISRQLKKNLEFKEYGPGSPTVVAIHSKFIAIGTSKGLVIIFDHFQNVSHCVRFSFTLLCSLYGSLYLDPPSAGQHERRRGRRSHHGH